MPKQKITDFRITEAIRLIELNFDQDLDFNRLAEFFDLSPSRLRHLFKEQTGLSFKKYLRQVRLKRAQYLLKTTFLSINKIAQQVRIRDNSHFVRNFEKEFGLSPDKYRKQYLSYKEKPDSNTERKKF